MDDLISRQAAIAAMTNYFARWAEYTEWSKTVKAMVETAQEAAREMLIELPSAQPEQRWIPCKTRLPEDLEEVNVTWINHRPEPYYEFAKDKPFTASAVYYKGDWYWYSSTCADILREYGKNDIGKVDDAIEITAWKPIGEPWRGEEDDIE